MKVVLLNPRLRTWSPNMWVPLGLAYVAAALEQAGHGVSILDLNATKVPDRQLVQRLNGADVVGITGMITEYQEVVRLARLIKQGASATVVLGGALATTMPRELLAASSADFAVVGEGEDGGGAAE